MGEWNWVQQIYTCFRGIKLPIFELHQVEVVSCLHLGPSDMVDLFQLGVVCHVQFANFDYSHFRGQNSEKID